MKTMGTSMKVKFRGNYTTALTKLLFLDMEKLGKALEEGFISRTFFEKVKEKVKEKTEVNVI